MITVTSGGQMKSGARTGIIDGVGALVGSMSVASRLEQESIRGGRNFPNCATWAVTPHLAPRSFVPRRVGTQP